MRIFKITKKIEAVCRSENTRYGFRHLAELQRDGWKEIATAKCCYYNRTWERYEFESVLEGLLGNSEGVLSPYELKAFKRCIKNGLDNDPGIKRLKTISMVASLGDIFGKDQKQKNDWKSRMLKAGLEGKGLIMPDDWDQLSEDDKEKRLNGAIEQLN